MPELSSGLAADPGRLEMVAVAGLAVGHREAHGLPVGPHRDGFYGLGGLVPLRATVAPLIAVAL